MNTTEQKNILFVTRPLCEPWDEASKNFAYDLAKNVTSQNITILTNGTIENAPQHITQKPIYHSPHFSLLERVRLLAFLVLHAKDFDIIHLLFTPTKMNSWIMQRILPKNVKIIQTIATVRDDLYSDTELRQIFFADTLVTYSNFALNKVTSLFSNSDSKKSISHIYPGIDLNKFTPREKSENLMKKWGISEDDTVISYPGEFARLGATDLIINTFIELWSHPNNHHIKYLCACRIKNNDDAQKKNEVIERLRSRGHLDKIIFTDTFGDMNAIYNLSDVIIFPVTTMRGKFDVPLAMIEPYACKKPVIASDLELFAEFSSSEINVIIPQSDESRLTHAIRDLSSDSQKRIVLGENAFAFAHKTFDITNIAQKYTQLYEKL